LKIFSFFSFLTSRLHQKEEKKKKEEREQREQRGTTDGIIMYGGSNNNSNINTASAPGRAFAKRKLDCPLCSQLFDDDVIEQHVNACLDRQQQQPQLRQQSVHPQSPQVFQHLGAPQLLQPQPVHTNQPANEATSAHDEAALKQKQIEDDEMLAILLSNLEMVRSPSLCFINTSVMILLTSLLSFCFPLSLTE